MATAQTPSSTWVAFARSIWVGVGLRGGCEVGKEYAYLIVEAVQASFVILFIQPAPPVVEKLQFS